MTTSIALHNSILAEITRNFHAHQMGLVSQQTGLALASRICIIDKYFGPKSLFEVDQC